MSCMCGGCGACLRDQGWHDEPPLGAPCKICGAGVDWEDERDCSVDGTAHRSCLEEADDLNHDPALEMFDTELDKLHSTRARIEAMVAEMERLIAQAYETINSGGI